MQTHMIDIDQAQAHFLEWLRLVEFGDEIILMRSGQPFAKLVSYIEQEKEREPVAWAGKV